MNLDHHRSCYVHGGFSDLGCTCGALERAQREAVEWLIAILQAVVPLAAAMQQERSHVIAYVLRLGDASKTSSDFVWALHRALADDLEDGRHKPPR